MPEARLTWILPLIVTLGLVTALVMIPGGQFTAFVPYSDGIVMPINGAYDTNSTVPLALPMAPSTISLNGYQTAGALARVTLISNFGQTTLLDTTLRGTDGQLMIGRGSITEENDSVRFTQACAGNCFVNATNESVLLVEVTNGTFTLDNITYTPAEIEMNNAPMSIGGAMNLTITHENSTQIDLTPYFTDTDGDALTFVATENSHFNVTVSGSILTVTAFGNWTGTDNLTVIASDLKELTRAEFIISVIGEATEMELVVANAPFYVEKQVADEIDAAGETIVLVEMDLKATKPLTREAGNGALEARTAKDEIISARENVLKGGKKAGKSEEAGALAEDGISESTVNNEAKLQLERGYDNIPLMAVRVDGAGLKELTTRGGIKAVYADKTMSVALAESLPLVHAPEAWNITINETTKISGAGQSVCVLDTGLDMTHPAFANRTLSGYDFVSGDDNPTDDNGHGTHVTGIVLATAPGATIVPVKVCSGTGQCLASDIVAGIDYCLNLSSQGVNVSALNGAFGDGRAYNSSDCPTGIDTALAAAWNYGTVNVFAAGNDGTDGATYPACSPYSLSVGAVDKNGVLAGFSNRGPAVEIYAPGVNVNSTLPGGEGVRSGTSMSSGFVSGTIAAIKEYTQLTNTTTSPQSIENTTITSADNTTGWPILDMHAAILKSAPATTQENQTPSNITTNQTTIFQTLAAPVAERVNITPYNPNSTTSVAGVWNYTGGDGPENGTTWTWFINNTEGWRDAGLVAYWKLDGNANDSVGTNNGTILNATNTTGIIKKGILFNGTKSDLINIGSPPH